MDLTQMTSGRIESLLSGLSAPCAVSNLAGRTLMLSAPSRFTLRDSVKVESGNNLWMGEVWACEPAGDGFHIEVEVHSMLTNVAAVDTLAARFRQTAKETDDTGGLEDPRKASDSIL